MQHCPIENDLIVKKTKKKEKKRQTCRDVGHVQAWKLGRAEFECAVNFKRYVEHTNEMRHVEHIFILFCKNKIEKNSKS